MLGSVTGLGSSGSLADGSTPAGRVVPGSCVPTPAGVSPAPAVAGLVAGAVVVTRTLPDAVAEAFDCGEVPVAVRVRCVPAAFCGTATAARNWTAWPAVRATEHEFPPVAGQTVKLGASLPGAAVMLTLAVPFTVPASQTQTA